MGLIAPAALALLLLAGPIIILYLLKLRREQRPVSSLLLWPPARASLQANQPWQRFRWSWLLLLQLLVLVALVLGSARPFRVETAQPTGRNVLVLDTSASMGATDVPPSRLEAAKREARRYLDSLHPDDEVALVVGGRQARVVVSPTRDRDLVRRALDAVRVTAEPSDLGEVLRLAVGIAGGPGQGRVVLLSDGVVPNLPLGRLPVPLEFRPVGARGNNLGITAVQLRPGPGGDELFVRLDGSIPQAERVMVRLLAGGRLLDAREVAVSPEGGGAVVFSGVPPGEDVLEVVLDVNDDLAADNRVWVARSDRQTVRVLYQGRGNIFLERAIGLIPWVEVARLAPDNPLPGERFDLYIFDGVPARVDGVANWWWINPPAGAGPGFEVGTEVLFPEVTFFDPEHPLLRSVDLGSLALARTRTVTATAEWRVLATAGQYPILLARDTETGRQVVSAFNLQESDFPLQPGFPIFVANLVAWTGRTGPASMAVYRPGDPVPVRVRPEATQVKVIRPDGSELSFEPRSEVFTFNQTDQLGVYAVVQVSGGRELGRSVVAINLLSPDESRTAPRSELPVIGSGAQEQPAETEVRRELWEVLALAALGLMLLEWWAFYRGIRVHLRLPRPFGGRRLGRA
ncbi:MAG: hypothetical protein C4316_06190 [Chloroflexota bacterium]